MSTEPKRHPFLDDLAEDVTLVSSILRKPVTGRDAVLKIVKAGGSIYLNQTPTFLGTVEDRTLFEYTFDLAEGPSSQGMVSIRKNSDGDVTHLNIAFSPIDAVLNLAEGVKNIVSKDFGPDLFF